MIDRATLLMAVGFVAGTALLAYELQREPALPPPPDSRSGEAIAPPELPPNEIRSLAAYDAISERPLFTPERRPAADDGGQAAQTAQADTIEDIDGFRLTAVLQGFGSKTALVEDAAGKTRIIHQGEKLGNWEVQEILADHIVVLLDAQRKTLLVHRFDPVNTNETPGRRSNPPTSGRRVIQPSQQVPAAARTVPGARVPIRLPNQP